jgi:hypothetical protein
MSKHRKIEQKDIDYTREANELKRLLDEQEETDPPSPPTEEEKKIITDDIENDEKFIEQVVRTCEQNERPPEYISEERMEEINTMAELNDDAEYENFTKEVGHLLEEEDKKRASSQCMTKEELAEFMAAIKATMNDSGANAYKSFDTTEFEKQEKKHMEALRLTDDILINIKKIDKSDVQYPDNSYNPGYYFVYADFTNTPFGNKIHILPGRYRIIPTNITYDIPEGYEIKVRSIFDRLSCDSRFEVKGSFSAADTKSLYLVVHNFSQEGVIIEQGQKIAEMTVAPIFGSSLVIIE